MNAIQAWSNIDRAPSTGACSQSTRPLPSNSAYLPDVWQLGCHTTRTRRTALPRPKFPSLCFWLYGSESSYRLHLVQYLTHQRNGSRHADRARPPTLALPMDTGLPHGRCLLGPYHTIHAPCCYELHTSAAALAYGPEQFLGQAEGTGNMVCSGGGAESAGICDSAAVECYGECLVFYIDRTGWYVAQRKERAVNCMRG